VSCLTTLDLVDQAGWERAQDGLKETFLSHVLTLYSGGDVNVECAAAIGTAAEGSSTRFYPSVTNGAADGACAVAASYSSGRTTDAGNWSFNVRGGGPNAHYTHSGHPLDQFAYRFTESDCSVLARPDLEWTNVALSDVFD
jgi:hypothetical protein